MGVDMIKLVFSKYLDLRKYQGEIFIIASDGKYCGELYDIPNDNDDLFTASVCMDLEEKYQGCANMEIPYMGGISIKDYCDNIDNEIIQKMMCKYINYEQARTRKSAIRAGYFVTDISLKRELIKQKLYKDYLIRYYEEIKDNLSQWCKNNNIHFFDDLGKKGLIDIINLEVKEVERQEKSRRKVVDALNANIKDSTKKN